MALDTDNLLELVRSQLAAALKDPRKIHDAYGAFGRLDEALCAGADLPEDWLTEPVGDGDDDDGDAGEDGDEVEGDPEMDALRGGGE